MHQIHLSRDGQTIGQFSPEELRNLYLNQQTKPGDHIWHAGATDWMPIEQFMRERMGVFPPQPKAALKIAGAGDLPPKISTPPPLPGVVATGAFGEFEESVLNGGRFVIYPYCISIVILTFRRSSDVVFLKPGQDGFGQVIGYSLASLVLGWWGFPWGPIFTIQSLVQTISGGKDITREVLAEKLGQARASEILARRGQAPKTSGRLRGLQIAIGAGAAILIGILMLAIFSEPRRSTQPSRPITQTKTSSSKTPKSSASSANSSSRTPFETADRNINVFRGQASFGNNDKAREIATIYAKILQETLGEAVKSSKSGLSTSEGNFITHCELRDKICVFVVHVPDLRHFDAESKKLMGDMAFVNGLSALQNQSVTNELKLVVGVRGALLYDRVLEGKYEGKFDKDHLGKKPSVFTSGTREILAQYFASSTN